MEGKMLWKAPIVKKIDIKRTMKASGKTTSDSSFAAKP